MIQFVCFAVTLYKKLWSRAMTCGAQHAPRVWYDLFVSRVSFQKLTWSKHGLYQGYSIVCVCFYVWYRELGTAWVLLCLVPRAWYSLGAFMFGTESLLQCVCAFMFHTKSLVQCVCAFMFGTESWPQSMQICLPPKQNPSLHSGPRWNLFPEVISKGFLRGRIIFWSSLKRMHFPRHLFCKYLDKK